MTRKDYELIATSIKTHIDHYDAKGDWPAHSAMELFALSLSRRLEKENPRFSRKIFLKACGMEGRYSL